MIIRPFRILTAVCLFAFALSGQETQRFVDISRGYAIDYPPPLLLQGGSYSANAARRDTHYIRIILENKLWFRGEFNDFERRHKSFRDHVIDVAIRSSGADGPDGSVWCENIDSVSITRNRGGVMYAEMYFLKASEGAGGNRSEVVGPFFVIDISSKTARQSLYLDWRPAWKPTSDQTQASRAIVEGIRLLN